MLLREYRFIEATTAEEALIVFRDRQTQFDLLLADVTLPTISGTQVALLLRFYDPSLPVILTSDYSVSDWPRRDFLDFQRLASSRTVLLQKPFQAEVLLKAVRELLGTLEPKTARAT